jgi:hypothetical protein
MKPPPWHRREAAAWSSGTAKRWSPLRRDTDDQNHSHSSHQIFTPDCQQQLHRGMAWLPPSSNWCSWFQVILQWAGPGYWLPGSTCQCILLSAGVLTRVGGTHTGPTYVSSSLRAWRRALRWCEQSRCVCILMMGYIRRLRAGAAWPFHGSYMTGKVESIWDRNCIK